MERVKHLIDRLDLDSVMAVLTLMNLCSDAIDLLSEVDVAEVPASEYWKNQVASMISEWVTRIKADKDEPATDD